MRFTVWLKIGPLIASCFYTTGYAHGQVDMSQCFPKMLQQQRSFNSLTNFELSYLAKLSEDDWNATHRQGVTAVFGIAATSFADFDTKRTQLFSEKRLDISHFQSISLTSVTLDPPAYEVMKECIKTKASEQKGLRYVPVAYDEDNISIRFFWNPTNPPYTLKASGYIDNAKNIDPSVESGQLFAPGQEIYPDGPTIQLTRIDRAKRVRVVLKTTPPEVGIEPIKIEVFSPLPKYQQVTVKRTRELIVDPEKYKKGEENFDSIYEISEPVGGTVISTECSFRADYYHMDSCSPNRNTFHCRAHKQRSDTRSNWHIKVVYLEPVERCISNCGSPPTPFPDEDDASNYSLNTQSALNDRERGCTWAATRFAR